MTPAEIAALNKSLQDLVKEIKEDRRASGGANPDGTPRAGGPGGQTSRTFGGGKTGEDKTGATAQIRARLELLEKEQEKIEDIHNARLLSDETLNKSYTDLIAAQNEYAMNLDEDRDKWSDQEKAEHAAFDKKMEFHELELKFRGLVLDEQDNVIEATEEELKKRKLMNKEMREKIKLAKKAREEETLNPALEESAEGLVGSFASMMGVQEQAQGGMASMFTNLVKGGAGAEAVMSGLSAGAARFLNWQALAVSALQKLGEFVVFATLRYDKLAASLAATTGQGRKYFNETVQMSKGTTGLVASTGELVEQAGKMQNSLAGLQGMSRGQVSAFAEVGLMTDRLGVSTDDYTSILSHQMTVMGKSGPQAQQMMGTLHAASDKLGMSFGDLASMMASSQKSFASFGGNADKIFLRTAGTARQLGMEIGDLVSLGEKFDTFDSAASSVADLNYLMGGQFLDTMEMMSIQNEEGPAGVAMAIKEQFEATGKSIEDMSRHQKKAMAEAAGMDEGTMTKFLTGEIDETQLDGLEEAVDPMTRLAESANQAMDFLSGIGKAVMAFGDMMAEALGLDKLGAMMSDLFGGGSGGMMDMMRSVFEFMEPTFGFIRRAIKMVIQVATPLVTVIGSMVKILWAILKPIMAIGQIIGGVIFDIAEVVLTVFLWPFEKMAMVADLIGDTFSILGELAYDIVKAIGAPILGLSGFIRDTLLGLRDIIEMPFKLAFDLVKDLLGYIKTGLDSLGNWVASGSKKITDWVLSPFIQLKDLLVGFFTETIPNAIKDGLGSGIDWIKEKLLALVSWIPGLGPDDKKDEKKIKPATPKPVTAASSTNSMPTTSKKIKPVTAQGVAGGMASALDPPKDSSGNRLDHMDYNGMPVVRDGQWVNQESWKEIGFDPKLASMSPEDFMNMPIASSPKKITDAELDAGEWMDDTTDDFGQPIIPPTPSPPKKAPGIQPRGLTPRERMEQRMEQQKAPDTNVSINVDSRKLADVLTVMVENVITDKQGQMP